MRTSLDLPRREAASIADMLTNDDCRRILRRPDLSDKEADALRADLALFLNLALDAYFAQRQREAACGEWNRGFRSGRDGLEPLL